MAVEGIYQATLQFLNRKIEFTELDDIYESYMKIEREERLEKAVELTRKFSVILDASKKSILYYYFASFLIYATESAEVYNEFIKKCLEDTTISNRIKFFLYSYLGRMGFIGMISGNDESGELVERLYQSILFGFKKEISKQYEYIPVNDRNQNLIFVLTTQFLNLVHAPTKTALDRAEVLKQEMDKEVFIINTAELLSPQDKVVLFRNIGGKYVKQLQKLELYTYHDVLYPFFQCPAEMPSASVIQEIMDVVASEKPLCIVTIGGNSIVSDLCSGIVPTITIATVYSGRSQTCGQFQVLGRKISVEDLAWAEKKHLSADHFIESVFTFSFKEQEHHYSRKDLGLPEGAFIVALVGGRLNDEIDEECIHFLRRLMEQEIYVAFVGGFPKYEELRKDSMFDKYGINMGMQEDILAVLECIDLFVNPKRNGGGSSVAEALYKGVPVVTIGYGDGAAAAGEDFFVENYDEMLEMILRYRSDEVFYAEMRQRGKERAEVLTNSSGEFVKIMKTAMSREGFQ